MNQALSSNFALDEVRKRLQGVTREQLLAMEPEDLHLLDSFLSAEADDKMDADCKANCLYWLQNWTATNNPQYLKMGLSYRAPFPRKSYFEVLFKHLESEDRLFIAKSRDMMVSLSICGFSTHKAQWFKEETIMQTASEDKAGELVSYCVNFWENQHPALKERHPLKTKSAFEIAWADGGRVLSIPSGEDKIRLFHPSRYCQDESAFLPEAEQCFNAAAPVCQQIICVSTAGPGWFANQCST